MSRKVYNYNPIGKGIEFIEIRDDQKPWNRTHVVRVEISRAMPFYVGSLALNKIIAKGLDKLNKSDIYGFANKANKGMLDYSIFNHQVMPMWISNGTFFGDDCFNYDTGQRPHPKISHSWMAGTIVSKGRAIASPPTTLLAGKNKRTTFLQRFRPNRIDIVRQSGYYSANKAARDGWSSAIGGGGSLVENGEFRDKDWWHEPNNGAFDVNQTYCCGPVIAFNNSLTHLYMIMDKTNTNGKSGHAAGRTWEQMSLYLKSSFLREINRSSDGSIEEAVVYDGGGSRGLWIHDYYAPPVDSVKNIVDAYNNTRPIPQFICLWGQPI